MRYFRPTAALFLVLLTTGVYCVSASSQAEEDKVHSVADSIQRIKDEKSPSLRTSYAQQLAESIRSTKPDVSDAEIDELAKMMSDRDDSVRYWIATSIGYLGPRAKRTVPHLEQALKEKACDTGSKTSASAIRLALTRIGVEPPVFPCK